MAKIIPWTLPDVRGGSIGGYTPQPTPEPVTNYPFDLDGLVYSFKGFVAKFNIKNESGSYWKILGVYNTLNISGVEILDATAVSSVIANVTLPTGFVVTYTGTRTNGQTETKTITLSEDVTVAVDISSIMTSAGGDAIVQNGSYEYAGVGVDDIIKELAGYDYGSNWTSVSVLTTGSIALSSVVVYNSNGVPIQEWMPE